MSVWQNQVERDVEAVVWRFAQIEKQFRTEDGNYPTKWTRESHIDEVVPEASVSTRGDSNPRFVRHTP